MKKLLAMLLVLGMVVGCCACGENTNDTPDVPDDGQEENQGEVEGNDGKEDQNTLPKTVSEDGVITAEKNTYGTLSEYEEYIDMELTLSEAPMLKEKVEAGELPALEDRLPKEPLVMIPLSEEKTVGTYGGTIRTDGMVSLSSYTRLTSTDWNALVSSEYNYTQGLYGNVVDTIDISDDKTEYTFHIREGLKWSNGVPCTTKDVEFWYYDVIKNEEMTPSLPGYLTTGGEEATVEFVDEYTFKITFGAPWNMNEGLNDLVWHIFCYQKEHASQWHPSYVEADELAAKLEEAGFETWTAAVNNQSLWSGGHHPGVPVLSPYMCVEETEETATYERNPYYFAVDAVGQQLPYIDKVIDNKAVTEAAVADLRVIEGDSDIRRNSDITTYSLFMEESQDGNIKVTRWGDSATNAAVIMLNQDTVDEDINKLFKNKDFRFALSHAINREEIIKLNYLGILEAKQATWSKFSKYYSEAAYNAGIEYDVAKANELLDSIGLDQKDADGYRLLANGQRVEIYLVYRTSSGYSAHSKVAELIGDYWNAVGISTSVKGYDGAGISELNSTNELQVLLYSDWGTNEGSYGEVWGLGVPWNNNTFWAKNWAKWYTTGGAEGTEPLPEVKEALANYDKYLGAQTEEENAEYMQKLLDYQAENLFTIGICEPSGYVFAYNSKLKNVPTDAVAYDRGDCSRLHTWYYAE